MRKRPQKNVKVQLTKVVAKVKPCAALCTEACCGFHKKNSSSFCVTIMMNLDSVVVFKK